MAIPYLGAVVLLPVTVLFRIYSLEYLSQFGSDYIMTIDTGEPDEPAVDDTVLV